MRRAAALLVACALAACDAPTPPKPAAPPPPPPPPAAPAPPQTFTFEGRVFSDLDEDVTLELAAVDHMPPCWGGPREPVERHTATVAPGARFRFENVTGGVFWVTASSPTSALHDYRQTTVKADVHEFDVYVRRACRLKGHVTYGEGIDPADCWISYDLPTGRFQLGDHPQNGRFVVERLEPGEVGVHVLHWPGRGPDGADPPLRVESYVKAVLVPGDNDVEIRIDAKSPPAR